MNDKILIEKQNDYLYCDNIIRNLQASHGFKEVLELISILKTVVDRIDINQTTRIINEIEDMISPLKPKVLPIKISSQITVCFQDELREIFRK